MKLFYIIGAVYVASAEHTELVGFHETTDDYNKPVMEITYTAESWYFEDQDVAVSEVTPGHFSAVDTDGKRHYFIALHPIDFFVDKIA